ncbi:sce7726 family protein [Actinotalea sp. C106]|uniref:sce7726 family protein n=1 Tax=Actinotalea sp. C106 TaxID=2908644 RepID=UPI0035ABBAAE
MRDGEIRHALLQQLAADHAHDPDTRVWPELSLCLGEARVDVGVVNGALSGFEIKSARDRLTRLPRQREVYERCLDYVTIVIEERWSQTLASHVPEWWGVIVARESGSHATLEDVRPARRNSSVDPLALAQLLWRDEAAAVVQNRGIRERTSRLTRWDLWDLLVEHLTLEELSCTVRDHLRARPAREASALPMPDGAMSRSTAR